MMYAHINSHTTSRPSAESVVSLRRLEDCPPARQGVSLRERRFLSVRPLMFSPTSTRPFVIDATREVGTTRLDPTGDSEPA